MISTLHEVLVELFRRQPELARELLRRCMNTEIPGARTETGSIDLTQVTPTEYRADAVVIARDASGRAVHAVVVEVQLHIDRKKELVWPVYVTALRARMSCPVTLLVITPEHAVAEWARRPIFIGIGMSLNPRVVSYEEVPRLDGAHSAAQPELAILSALAHEDLPSVARALEELRQLPEGEQDIYFDLLEQMLPETLRRLRMDFKNYEFRGETATRMREEARQQGREEGRRQVLRDLIVERYGVPEHVVEARLTNLDEKQLRSVTARVISAPTFDELFDD